MNIHNPVPAAKKMLNGAWVEKDLCNCLTIHDNDYHSPESAGC